MLGLEGGGEGKLLEDGVGALEDGVVGQLSGEETQDGRQDVPRARRLRSVDGRQTEGVPGDPLEDVVHEGVHDDDGLEGDPRVRMDLVEDLVDGGGVGLVDL